MRDESGYYRIPPFFSLAPEMTAQTSLQTASFGTWPSPIGAAMVAAGATQPAISFMKPSDLSCFLIKADHRQVDVKRDCIGLIHPCQRQPGIATR